MRHRIALFTAVMAVAGILGGFACQKGSSDTTGQTRLVRAFLAVVPDSIDSERRLEIEQLFYLLYQHAEQGEVPQEDVARINREMARYVDRGRITASELVHFMADVGYTTYKGIPRYNLADSSVDHPILNPASAMYSFRREEADSAFWADYDSWRAQYPPDMPDSLLILELLRNPPQR